MAQQVNIKNKKARHLYEILEQYEAGIELYGTEIKSVRQSKANLSDGYCVFVNHELYVKMHISEYTHGSYSNHEPRRERKLLLHRRELNKLEGKVKTKGLTIVPLSMYIAANGMAKLQIALVKGKREFDKRETMKQRDSQRELDQIKKRDY